MQNAKSLNPVWRILPWMTIPLYLIANAYLILLGEIMSVLMLAVYAVYVSVFALLTKCVTQPFVTEEQKTSESKFLSGIQVGILLIIIVLTGFASSRFPIWSSMVTWTYDLGESILPVEWFGGPGNALANPLQYFVIPFVFLLCLGAKPSELGFGKGNKVLQACLVWLVLPLVSWVVLLATGSLLLQTLLRRIIGNTFQNGFFEEFLFRGALQTRLRKWMSIPWALTLQAILFGVWHLRANTEMMDGNLLAGLALCLVSQSVAGFVYGYVFHRTRNLIAPSVAHVVMNVLGQSFG